MLSAAAEGACRAGLEGGQPAVLHADPELCPSGHERRSGGGARGLDRGAAEGEGASLPAHAPAL